MGAGLATTAALGSAGVPTGVMALGSALSLGAKYVGGQQQKSQIDTQIEQEKAANAARGADRSRQLNETIARNAVMGGAKGLGAGSSVFRQVTQQSFDAYHEDQERDNLNLSFKESALRSKITAIDAQTFGDIFEAGSNIVGMHYLEKKPSTSEKKSTESSFFGF